MELIIDAHGGRLAGRGERTSRRRISVHRGRHGWETMNHLQAFGWM
jgi:hypothetical protein